MNARACIRPWLDAWGRRLVSCILALSWPGLASASDRWLEVEPFSSPAPVRGKVYLMAGERLQQAEPRPVRQRASITRFYQIGPGGKRDLLPALHEDQEPVAVIGPAPAGTTVLGMDMSPAEIELSGPRFQSYLLDERLIDVLSRRAAKNQEDQPGHERYSRHLKAIMQVGGKLDKAATQPLGQELEIVPQQHPYGLAPGGTLTVQVLFHGKPLPGRAVTCANRYRASVAARTTRTDAAGRASFLVSRPGDWLLTLVHMEPSHEPDVDWRSYWASLSFSVPQKP